MDAFNHSGQWYNDDTDQSTWAMLSSYKSQSPIWTWLVNYLHLHLHLQKSEREKPQCGETTQHAPTQTPCNQAAIAIVTHVQTQHTPVQWSEDVIKADPFFGRSRVRFRVPPLGFEHNCT